VVSQHDIEARWNVIHGDCIQVMQELPDGCIDAVITDPPYSSGGMTRGDRSQTTVTKYVNSNSIVGAGRANFDGDNRDQRSFLAWCSLWMTEAERVTKPGGVMLCFSDWRQVPILSDAVQCGGWVWRGLGTWWKPGVRMQRGRFSASAEFVIYASRGVPTPGERSPQNVVACPPVGGDEKQHIAEKPVEVMKWLTGLTPSGSLILDPFAGSGSTGVACVSDNRRFVGIERNIAYVEAARNRIKDAASQTVLPL
jgi:site-specific DNA-methyltransferase (adenine-specific)